jgi:phosphate transport system permease protein
LAVDEYRLASWALFADGTIEAVRLDRAGDEGESNPRIDERKLFAGGPGLTAAAFSLTSEDAALGFADGSIRLGTIGFRTRFVDADQLDEAARRLQPGEVAVVDRGLIERTPEGQFRREELAVEFGEPLATLSKAAITHLDFSKRPSGMALASYSADGALAFHAVKTVRNLETDQSSPQLQSIRLPLENVAGRKPPFRVLISGVGDNVFAAWRDGRLLRYDVKNRKRPVLAEQIDLVAEPEAQLTALEFMIGKTTLAAGDSLGQVRGWFRVNASVESEPSAGAEPGGQATAAHAAAAHAVAAHMVAAHELPGDGQPVVSLAASARSRMLAAGYADGQVRLYYLTNDCLLLQTSAHGQAPFRSLAISPKDDALLGAAADSLCLWRLDAPHPEITLGSLFLPVWYEGNARPSYDWQSSGGTDDFEPKLGLMPLVFGTLKVTFYSLLFGVPLALLAAVYTSEFLHPRARARIKPTIELMASLPSVVLGFVAALALAPLVEGILPAILTSLATVPFTLLLAAFLWQAAPAALRLSLGHYRLVFMCLALPAGAALAWRLGPLVERWLFAGDLKSWLEGTAGDAAGGWMLLLAPVAALIAAWLSASYVQPWLRRRSVDWSDARMAAVELVKFCAATTFALLLALAASKLLSGLGIDSRGSVLGPYNQRNVLIVGFVMGFAIIPIIYTIAEDALSSVPHHLRSASLGAGATPWQTATRIIIPTAMSGLFSAVMVGLGRAVGETMIVLMAAGNTPVMDWNLFNGGRSLSANLAVELAEAVRDSTHYRTLFFAALVLFALTFVLNTVAENVRQRFRKRAFQL